MSTKEFFLLVAVVIIGGTIANLIALKIAAVEVQKQLDAGASTNPFLKLLR